MALTVFLPRNPKQCAVAVVLLYDYARTLKRYSKENSITLLLMIMLLLLSFLVSLPLFLFVAGTKTYSFLDGDCTDSEAAYLLAISEKVCDTFLL